LPWEVNGNIAINIVRRNFYSRGLTSPRIILHQACLHQRHSDVLCLCIITEHCFGAGSITVQLRPFSILIMIESGKYANKLDGSTQFNQKPQNPTESNNTSSKDEEHKTSVCFPFGFLSQTGFTWLQFHFCLHFSRMRREQDVMFTPENKNEIIHTSFMPFCHQD